jgi:hypothetical protein
VRAHEYIRILFDYYPLAATCNHNRVVGETYLLPAIVLKINNISQSRRATADFRTNECLNCAPTPRTGLVLRYTRGAYRTDAKSDSRLFSSGLDGFNCSRHLICLRNNTVSPQSYELLSFAISNGNFTLDTCDESLKHAHGK